jgi:hypothetical protein
MANSKNHQRRNGIVCLSPMGRQRKANLATIVAQRRKDRANERKQISKQKVKD